MDKIDEVKINFLSYLLGFEGLMGFPPSIKSLRVFGLAPYNLSDYMIAKVLKDLQEEGSIRIYKDGGINTIEVLI